MKVVIHTWQEADRKPPGIYDTLDISPHLALQTLLRDMQERGNAPDHGSAMADCTTILIDALRVLARVAKYQADTETLIAAYERIIRG